MLLENTTIMILDDEPDALTQSREAMEQFVPSDRILTATDQSQALEYIGKGKVDLLFLDVEMPGLDGFTLADYIHKLRPELKYVFLTGHVELGAESYDYEPIGFLSKPIDVPRLRRTLERFRDSQEGDDSQRAVALETGGAGFALVAPADIRYIAREGRRTVIYCTGQVHQVKYTLEALETIFFGQGLFRIHKSMIVPLGRIALVQSADFGRTFQAVLDDGTSLPVSRRGYAKLREQLEGRGIRFV